LPFFWAVGFAIAARAYFKGVKKDSVAMGWIAGITWYIELIVLDLIVLVGAFGMVLTDFYPILLTYLNVVVISVAIGCILKK